MFIDLTEATDLTAAAQTAMARMTAIDIPADLEFSTAQNQATRRQIAEATREMLRIVDQLAYASMLVKAQYWEIKTMPLRGTR